MKSHELHKFFNETFGLERWPSTYEVDAETYGYCCQAVFDWSIKDKRVQLFKRGLGDLGVAEISLGPNSGLMFKTVELILKAQP